MSGSQLFSVELSLITLSLTHIHTQEFFFKKNSLYEQKFTRARRGEIGTVVVIKEIKPKTSKRKLFYMKISLSLVV